MKCNFCGRELTTGESPEMYKGLCYTCYLSIQREPLSYRLSADVNVKELFNFIVENIPYKKVLELRDLLNVSTKDTPELTLKALDQIRFLRGESE